MKKIVLSAVAALAVGSMSLSASQFYVDDKGQVFTTSAADRVALKSDSSTSLSSKATNLEFSGTHYFGYTSANPNTTAPTADASVPTTVAVGSDTAKYAGNSAGLELRRNYLQVKGFFNDKDYWRVTLDTTKELASSTSYANVFVKYAYLYMDKVLPYTGVEFGIAHRPWIDYEEHNGWYYRSFNKVMIEEKGTATESGVDLVNSADLGVNFKTKTDMFSSEIGIFNGEGYHADKKAANQENDSKMSVEWRLTGHLIGSGTKVSKNDRLKDTYAHISTFGLISQNHKDDTVAIGGAKEYDRSFYGIHAVYNQPMFLIAAQYLTAEDEARNPVADSGKEYDAFSINAEVRPVKDWTIIGRYDDYKIDSVAANTGLKTVSADGNKVIAGLAYKYNKNVSFIASGKFINEEKANGGDTGESKDVYMFTTEVKW
ncbi:MAG: hypothetical protein A2525_11840 [Sulfurimonas sp. RIFOXYD12_FULL_36_11]|jgi:hypothetical protein|nr:MAG: hypothetical protein A2525_11840 [Sulfurimonas sp. RIFOXYD12_FULL_36_11]OHE16058.1 MAG: hypothetical protein A2540_02240 [Sulfurimonas sp. RIFOXYD2_FULL_37_8]